MMLYTFPGGHQVQLEVVARLQMEPTSIDDGLGSLIVGQTPTAFIVFVQGGCLPSDGEHFAEFSTLRAAYAFALEAAKAIADEWADECDDAGTREADQVADELEEGEA